MLDLTLRRRIAVRLDVSRKVPICDCVLEVINPKLTGEPLLDETLEMMEASALMSVKRWIDLMSGEFQTAKSCFLSSCSSEATTLFILNKILILTDSPSVSRFMALQKGKRGMC